MMSETLQKPLSKYFLDGLYETVSIMTGFQLREKAYNEEDNPSYEVAGAMLLTGSIKSFLVLSTKKASAALLVSYMTGIEMNDLTDSMICDGISEMVNMVAGQGKAKMTESGHTLELSSPIAITGTDIKLITKYYVEKFQYLLVSNEIELKISIYYI